MVINMFIFSLFIVYAYTKEEIIPSGMRLKVTGRGGNGKADNRILENVFFYIVCIYNINKYRQ